MPMGRSNARGFRQPSESDSVRPCGRRRRAGIAQFDNERGTVSNATRRPSLSTHLRKVPRDQTGASPRRIPSNPAKYKTGSEPFGGLPEPVPSVPEIARLRSWSASASLLADTLSRTFGIRRAPGAARRVARREERAALRLHLDRAAVSHQAISTLPQTSPAG